MSKRPIRKARRKARRAKIKSAAVNVLHQLDEMHSRLALLAERMAAIEAALNIKADDRAA